MNKRIKAIRKDQKLTQANFGARIGVKGNTITNYESGARVPSDSIIVSICREYGVNESWLRTGQGEMYACPQADALLNKLILDPDLDELDRKILSVYAKLPIEYRKLLKEHISHVADSFSLMPHPGHQLSLDDHNSEYSEELKDEKKA